MSVQKTQVNLNFKPLPIQKALFQKLYLGAGEIIKRSCLVLPRRATKTVFSTHLMFHCAFEKFVHQKDLVELRYAYASPTLKQSRTNVWDMYKRALCNFPGYKPNEANMTIKLRAGQRQMVFYVWGLERPLDLKGGFLDGLILDEDATNPSDVFGEVFSYMLADPFHKGWCIRTGTPRGQNHFYDHYVDTMDKMYQEPMKYFAYRTSVDKLKHIDQDDIDYLIRTEGEEFVRQELYCDFNVRGAGGWYTDAVAQAERELRFCKINYDPRYPVFVSYDLGGKTEAGNRGKDYTALWFFQLYDGRIFFIDYYESNRVNVYDTIGILRKKIVEFGYNYGAHILPWDGDSSNFVDTPASIMKKQKIGKVIVMKRFSTKAAGIQAARGKFHKCLFDKNKCNLGIRALKEFRKKWSEEGRIYILDPAHNQYSHGADSFAIAMAGEEKIRLSLGSLIGQAGIVRPKQIYLGMG